MSYLRSLAGLLAVQSIYAAISLTSAGVCSIVANLLDQSPHWWFLGGFCIPLAPTYLYFTSRHVIEWRLAMLKTWRESKLINESEYKKFREALLDWYAERITGRRPFSRVGAPISSPELQGGPTPEPNSPDSGARQPP
jgi:hypothetical protein